MQLLEERAAPPSIPHRADDRSSHAHRQVIGYLGLALPVALIVIDWMLPTAGLPRWGLLDSISSYYYTAAIAAFVGLLVALALFLFTYRGYANDHAWADRTAAITAGVAALGVAFFPTSAPDDALRLAWWGSWMDVLHYASATVLFGMFAVFSLWLFRKTGPGPLSRDKRVRNHIYLACGIAIVIGMIWAFVNLRGGRPIFVPEALMLLAFAVSWLTKGYALRSIAAAMRSD